MKPPEDDELSKEIDAKIEQEQKEVGLSPPGGDGPFSEAEVYRAATSQQDGDSWLFYQIHKDQLLFDHAAAKWYEWQGHYWDNDKVDNVTRKLDAVIDLYSQQASYWSWKKLEATRKGDMRDADMAEKREKDYLKKISCLQKRRWKEDVIRLAAAGDGTLAMNGLIWDLDPYILPCTNGIVELKTANFRPGKQSDFIKTVAPTKWQGFDVPCPSWERFLSEIFDGESTLISFMHRLLGYSITGLTTEHILPIFWGQGRNGKSTLFDALHHTMGPLAGPVQSEMLLDQGRFRSSASPTSDIMALRGKRIVWGSETDEGRKLNIGKVKWLVGGDTLCGRAMYARDEVHFKPTHTLFLQTNHRPKVDPNDYALWQRLHLIPFTYSFVDDPQKPNERKRDPHLPEKLKEEASGILAWLVRGYFEWQEHGLKAPESVKAATAKYQESEDILGHFLDDCCLLDADKKIKAGQLYKAYSKWCDENGHKPISGTKFGERIKERFEWEKTNYVYYFGIALLDNLPF